MEEALNNTISLIKGIIAKSQNFHCGNYVDSLNLLSKDQPQVTLLHKILKWEINSNIENHIKYPLTPWLFSRENRATEEWLQDIFNEAEVSLLIALSDSNELEDSEIISRINDILWIYKHPPQNKQKKNRFALRAIENYILSADKLSDQNSIKERLTRASIIATQIELSPQNPILYSNLVNALSKNIDLNDHSNNTLTFLNLRLELDETYLTEVISFVEKILGNEELKPKMDIETSCDYYDLAIKHHLMTNKSKLEWQLSKINNLIIYADLIAERGNFPEALKHLQTASKELNNIADNPIQKKKMQEIINNKKKSYNKLPANMHWQKISIAIPIVDSEKESGKIFNNLSFSESLKILLDTFHSINYESIIENQKPLASTFSMLFPNQDGLQHDKNPKKCIYSEKEIENIYLQRSIYRKIDGKRTQLLLQSIYDKFFSSEEKAKESKEQLKEIITSNNLISEERLDLILNSICFAIIGDTCTASHLIVPQVESFLRQITKESGISIRELTHKDNHELLILSDLFSNDDIATVLVKEYGHDTYCEIYALLLDKRYGNYRNKICHGLMNFQDFLSEEIFYMWGLCAYIILKRSLFSM